MLGFVVSELAERTEEEGEGQTSPFSDTPLNLTHTLSLCVCVCVFAPSPRGHYVIPYILLRAHAFYRELLSTSPKNDPTLKSPYILLRPRFIYYGAHIYYGASSHSSAATLAVCRL